MSNVGYATLQIIPSARGFGTALNKGTAAPMAAAGTAGGKKFGGGMIAGTKSFLGPLAAIFAGVKVFGFLKGAIDEASSLGESVNALNVTYGKHSKGIQALGRAAADELGLSNLAFNNLAVRFSGFAGTIAGKGGNVTRTLDDLTHRAADFASVMNLDVAEAAGLFQSGLAGETEPLRRFGIDMSAASVQAFAYASGIAKSGAELTESQKVQARYGLLMKQTQKTQGDFANTSGALANQQRILGARWDNLKAILGGGLLPVVNSVVKALNGALGPAMDFVQGAVDGLSGGKGGGGFAALVDFGKALWPTLQKIGQQIMAVLGPAFREISAMVREDLLPAIREFLPAFEPVAKFLLQVIGSAVVGALKGLVNVVKGVLKIVTGLFQVFTAILTGDWSKAWEGIKNIVTGVFQALIGAFQVWLNVGILNIFRKGLLALKGLWTGAWKGLKSLATGGMNAIRNVFSSVFNAILGLVRGAVTGYVNLWKGLFSTVLAIVRNGWKVLRSAFGGALAAIRSVVSGALSAIRGFFSSAFSRIGSTVTNALSKITGALRSLPGRVKDAVSGAGSWLLSAGRDVISGFISGIRSMAGGVIRAISSTITDKLPGFVKKALGINSPSRVFMSLGSDTISGFVKGIDDQAGAAQKAMTKAITPPASPDLSAESSVAGALAASGSGTPVTVPLYLDGRKVAEAVFEIGGRDFAYGRKEF